MSMLLAFLGALSGPYLQLATTYNVSDLEVGSATAAFALESDGDIVGTGDIGAGDVGDWVVPRGAAGATYECQATLISGTLTSGTTGSWLSLGSNRSWSITQGSPGTKTTVFTLEIRHTVTLESVTTTVTLEAEAI